MGGARSQIACHGGGSGRVLRGQNLGVGGMRVKCASVEVEDGEDSLGGACGLSAMPWTGGLGSALTLGGSFCSQCLWMRRAATPMRWREQGAAAAAAGTFAAAWE